MYMQCLVKFSNFEKAMLGGTDSSNYLLDTDTLSLTQATDLNHPTIDSLAEGGITLDGLTVKKEGKAYNICGVKFEFTKRSDTTLEGTAHLENGKYVSWVYYFGQIFDVKLINIQKVNDMYMLLFENSHNQYATLLVHPTYMTLLYFYRLDGVIYESLGADFDSLDSYFINIPRDGNSIKPDYFVYKSNKYVISTDTLERTDFKSHKEYIKLLLSGVCVSDFLVATDTLYLDNNELKCVKNDNGRFTFFKGKNLLSIYADEDEDEEVIYFALNEDVIKLSTEFGVPYVKEVSLFEDFYRVGFENVPIELFLDRSDLSVAYIADKGGAILWSCDNLKKQLSKGSLILS